MRSSFTLATLGAAVVLAAPTVPSFNVDAAMPGSLQCMSDYFNMLAEKVQNHRWMSEHPVCDLSKVKLPLDGLGLPPPSEGLKLKHVAVGRGTQNYTCDVNNSTAPPVAAGALATLFNASCVAAAFPDLANLLPQVALQFNLTDEEREGDLMDAEANRGRNMKLSPTNLVVSGRHFFTNLTTPFFTLDTPGNMIGQVSCAKNSSVPAPGDAPVGQQGEAAVSWLKLLTRVGDGVTTGNLQEVYRVETAGGSPPATCAGMPEKFTVPYAAQYWFYVGDES